MTKRWGPYEILEELGRGGMGVVYQAWDHDLQRMVAIKTLNEQFARDKKIVERFVREARGAASLNHPNIVQVYFIGEQDGQTYFVMEHVVGETLAGRIKRKKVIGSQDAARLLRDVASGLAAAHDKGIIHRDIKPANIMINKEGVVKIADFGIARIPDYDLKLTDTGQFLGTPGYFSPEICMGHSPEKRSDIFSAGIVYFEMLTGNIPFNADSPYALMRQVAEARIPDVRILNNDVDGTTSEILKKMVQVNPEDRYESCQELMNHLDEYLQNGCVSDMAFFERQTVSDKSEPLKQNTSETDFFTGNLTDPLTPEYGMDEIEVPQSSQEKSYSPWMNALPVVVVLFLLLAYWVVKDLPDENGKTSPIAEIKRDESVGNSGNGGMVGLRSNDLGGSLSDRSAGDDLVDQAVASPVGMGHGDQNTGGSYGVAEEDGSDLLLDRAPELDVEKPEDYVVAAPPDSNDMEQPMDDVSSQDTLELKDQAASASEEEDGDLVSQAPFAVANTFPGKSVGRNESFDFENPALVVYAMGDHVLGGALERELEALLGDHELLDKDMNGALNVFEPFEIVGPQAMCQAASHGLADVVFSIEVHPIGEQELSMGGASNFNTIAQVIIRARLASSGESLNLHILESAEFSTLNARGVAQGIINDSRRQIQKVLSPVNLKERQKGSEDKTTVAIAWTGLPILGEAFETAIAHGLEKKGYRVLEREWNPESPLKDLAKLAGDEGCEFLVHVKVNDMGQREIEVNGLLTSAYTAQVRVRCIQAIDGRGLESINLDLEYVASNATSQVQEEVSSFMRRLTKMMKSRS